MGGNGGRKEKKWGDQAELAHTRSDPLFKTSLPLHPPQTHAIKIDGVYSKRLIAYGQPQGSLYVQKRKIFTYLSLTFEQHFLTLGSQHPSCHDKKLFPPQRGCKTSGAYVMVPVTSRFCSHCHLLQEDRKEVLTGLLPLFVWLFSSGRVNSEVIGAFTYESSIRFPTLS